MLGSALAFATMSACSHALADRCDWRVVAVARSGIAFLLTTAIAIRGGVHLVFHWPRTLWMRSIVGSLSMLFTFYALASINLATATTLFNTMPLWVTLLAWPVLGERPTAAVGLALLSAIIGIVLIEQPHAGDVRPASLAALFAAFCSAVVMLGLHRLRTLNSLTIVVHFSAVATLTCLTFLVVTAASGRPLDVARIAEVPTLALLAGVGGFATLGQIAMTKAYSVGAPQKLSIVGLAQVVFALAFDLAIWHRSPDGSSLAGIALVLAPVAWLVGRRPPRPKV
jgi:drug/metabolite transporter (DMT)-like permease